MLKHICLARIGILAAVVAGLCACSTQVRLDQPFPLQPANHLRFPVPHQPFPPPLQPPIPLPSSVVLLTRIEPAVGVPGAPAIHGATWTRFSMPLLGPVVAKFDGRTNPGIDIAGQPGAPILASRDGSVMLVSNALPAYGTMIVLKHVDEFITAYAHLGKILVQESDEVSQGQQIAELGSRGSGHDALHFEIRRMGVPLDPALYLQSLAR